MEKCTNYCNRNTELHHSIYRLSATELPSYNTTVLAGQLESELDVLANCNEDDLTQSLFIEAEREIELESRCVLVVACSK